MANSQATSAAATGGSEENQFDQAAFNNFVLKHKVIGFFDEPITLKSGRRSCWYVNWRTVSEDAFLLRELSCFLVEFVADLVRTSQLAKMPDTLFGVPEGATKAALFAQMKLAENSGKFASGSHVLPMGRGKPKEHGVAKDKYFLGVPRGATVAIEDVTTTGGSLIGCIQQLREAQIDCRVAIGLTNRMERRDDGASVAEALAALSPPVQYFHMSEAAELLPIAAASGQVPKAVLKSIEEEFEQYGVRKIKF